MVKTAEKDADTGHTIYGHVKSKADIDTIFDDIRADIEHAKDRPALTELYRRAGYLITLTYAPSWEKRFGDKATDLRTEAEAAFRKTARLINQRAAKIGVKDDYDEAWGRMKK
jgi:hypothetical protein